MRSFPLNGRNVNLTFLMPIQPLNFICCVMKKQNKIVLMLSKHLSKELT